MHPITDKSVTEQADFSRAYWRATPAVAHQLADLSSSAIDGTTFRLLADNIPTLCWIANGDGYIVWYNRRWHEYCGTAPNEMEGWGWQSVHDPDFLPAVMERWTYSIANGEPFEMIFPLRGADGLFRPFLTRVQPVRDGSGKVARWFGVNTEISAQQAAEEALRQSAARNNALAAEQAAILGQLTEGVIVTDPEGQIIFVNEAAERLHGTKQLGVRPDDYSAAYHLLTEGGVPYPPRQLPLARAALDGEIIIDTHWRIRRPDGSEVVAMGSARPIFRPDGTRAGAVLTLRDDTARRAAETERKLAEDTLFEETQRLETLNRTGAALAGELDLERIVQGVTDAGVQLTAAHFGAFFYNVINEAGKSYTLYTLSGADRSAFEGFPLPRATAVFRPTFHGEGVVRSDDILADPRYGKSAPHHGTPKGHLPVRSYLAVPVVSRSGEVIGGLFFGHPEPAQFNAQHERLMVGLGAQAAVAVDNARLYETAQRELAERRRAETRLSELNETLEQRVAEALAAREILANVVETTNVFIQVVDLEYRWLAINQASADEFERIFGIRPQVGAHMLDLLAHKPEHHAAVRAVWDRALSGEAFTQIDEVGDPSLDRRYYEMKFNPLLDNNGQRIGAYQFVYDVTERLRDQARLAEAEEQLRQSQKMEAVGQLTGGIAHDFNNLLTGIGGSLELLQARVAQGRTNDLERFVVSAQGAAKRAAALTHRLLAFSRRQTLDPKPTNVNRLTVGIEDLIRRTVGPAITVEVVTAGGLWNTLIDQHQLENALLNLCINARDAMPYGGRLTIETGNKWLDERAARERDLSPGQYISLCVSDNGTGMTPDVVARAFEPFFTTKPIGMGTGLGLSMIYGFVRQSGGQARIYSEPGHGAMVCLYLPRYRGEAEQADVRTEAADPPHRGRCETVLVVDDEPTVRMLVTEVLDDLGYSAMEAGDGPSGLKLLQSDARIDLLISDVGLPGGMNGRQLADGARALRPNLKVLFITGYAENAVFGNGHLEPGMHVLTKPFAMDALATRIKDLLA